MLAVLLVSLSLVATPTTAVAPAKRARARSATTLAKPVSNVEVPALPLAPVAPVAPPREVADVKMVARLADAIARAPSEALEAREALLPHFVDALMASCESVLRDSGVSDLRVARMDELRAETWQRLGASLKEMPEGPTRRAVLEGLARRVTTRAQAVSLLDWWFGLDSASGATPGAAKTPAATGALAPMKPWTAGEADLRLAVAHSRLLDEVGPLDGPDGSIDTGEWVRLGLGIENASSRPWFSTTAHVAASGGCLWSDPSVAHELAELGPGEVAELPVWVFVSAECPANARRALVITLCDSQHSEAAERNRIEVELLPRELGPQRLVATRLDADGCGSSDGSNLAVLRPKMRFELSHELSLPREPEAKVALAYRAPSALAPLFTRFEARDEPMVRGADRLLAGDDLDAEVAGEEPYGATLKLARAHRRWFEPASGGLLWLAMDAQVTLVPGAAEPAEESGCWSVAPTGEMVAALVRKHLALVPHSIEPEHPAGVVAASGYELAFDAPKFVFEYEELARPPRPPAEEEPEVFRSRFRYYVPLRLAGLPPEPQKPTPPPPPPAPEPAVVPVAEAAEARPWLRFDAGGSLGLVGLSAPPAEPDYWGQDSVARLWSFDARAFVGPSLSGMVAFRGGQHLSSLGGVNVAMIADLALDLGLGMHLGLGDSFELTPRVGAGYLRRTVFDSFEPQELKSNSFNAFVGGTGRLWLNRYIGIHGDLRLGFGPTGKYREVELIDGVAVQLGVGLSARL